MQPASGLNPEAGHHAITSDPRELAASLRASERTRAEFPYSRRRRRVCGGIAFRRWARCSWPRSDERNGIERAVLSMEEWAYDKKRFPQSWIRAARNAIAAARG